MNSDRSIVAHHEAGHAVVAIILGLKVNWVKIENVSQIPGLQNLHGQTSVEAPEADNITDFNQILNRIASCMAGDVAENIYNKVDLKYLLTASDDIENATGIANSIPGVENEKPIVHAAIVMAQAILNQPRIWDTVKEQANILMPKDEMTGDEIKQAVFENRD